MMTHAASSLKLMMSGLALTSSLVTSSEAQDGGKIQLRVESLATPQVRAAPKVASPEAGTLSRLTRTTNSSFGDVVKPSTRSSGTNWILHGTPAMGSKFQDALSSEGKATIQVFTPKEPATGTPATQPGALVQNGVPAPGSSKSGGKVQIQVVGGANPTSNDYIVAITYKERDSGPAICTGTLLNETTVLTAAHCACGEPGSYLVEQTDALGQVARGSAQLAGAPLHFARSGCALANTLFIGEDLALLKLNKALEIDPSRRPVIPASWPIELPYRQGYKMTVIGFGYTDKGELGRRYLGEVPLLTAHCDSWKLYGRMGCVPFVEMILAEAGGTRKPTDTCGGDSGGPVFDFAGGQTPVLVGVTSRPAAFTHVDAKHQCGGGGIYSVLGRRSVAEWIAANVPEYAGLSPNLR